LFDTRTGPMSDPMQELPPYPPHAGGPGLAGSSAADEGPEPAALGSVLGHYRIASVLSRDGTGVVYQAEDTRSQRRVALLQLPDALARDPQALRSYRAEVEAAARLTHPNLVAVYGVEGHEGGPLVVTEFVGGGSAADKLAALGRLPWRDATR